MPGKRIQIKAIYREPLDIERLVRVLIAQVREQQQAKEQPPSPKAKEAS